MTNKTLVIYDHDQDGFGCAWAAWKAFEDKVDYLEIPHGTDKVPAEAYNYGTVYIFDETFTESSLRSLAFERDENWEYKREVVIIDHHESAREMVERLGLNPIPFDSTRAACVQVWQYFTGYKVAPPILEYVADRDVWKWELPNSDAINNVIFLTDKDFVAWDDLNGDLVHDYLGVVNEGKAIIKYRDTLVDMIVAQHDVREDYVNAEHTRFGPIPTVGTPILHSEVGHRLLDMYPDAPFVRTYIDEPSGYKKVSLRSEDHRVDVSAIAKSYGGGGHRNAAGYRI